MTGHPAGTVARAALAGALAMAVFGAVEIWFTELATWALHRAAFAPLDGRFAAALFLLYLVAGAVGAGLVATAAGAAGFATDARAAGALVVLVAHGVFRLPAFAGGTRALLGSLNAILLGAALFGAWSPRPARLGRVLTGPWTSALLLCAPVWVMKDVLGDASRGVRALGFAAAASAIAVASLRVERRRARPRVFVTASLAGVLATLAAVAFVGPDAPRQGAMVAPAANGPSVLLVVLDTVRADHLSLYGYERDTTPNLRRFAESATVYARALAPSNMTLATHASLFTGLSATEHRAHYDAGRPAGRPLGTSMPTLAGILAARGYDTSSVAGNYGFLGHGFGLDRGFAWVDARPRRSTLGVIPQASVRGAFRRFLCGTLAVWPETDTRARAADEITDLAVGRIDHAKASGRPYFLFVNYFDAHERVLVPPPWAGSFARPHARATGPLFEARLRDMNATGRIVLTAREREDLVARYDETLAYLDAALGRLLAHAVGRGGEADTLVVVTADHGEAFGEHDSIGHGSTLYAEQVRVPLVVKEPRQAKGRLVEGPVGLAGVFALLAGRSAEVPAEDAVVSESFPLVPTPEKPGVHGGRALESGGRKLIRGVDGHVELFDVEKDPEERRDLVRETALADTASSLSARLDRWIAAHPPGRAPETSESREDRERLRSLGYLR